MIERRSVRTSLLLAAAALLALGCAPSADEPLSASTGQVKPATVGSMSSFAAARAVASLSNDPQGDFLWHLAESSANQAQVGLVGLATTGLAFES